MTKDKVDPRKPLVAFDPETGRRVPLTFEKMLTDSSTFEKGSFSTTDAPEDTTSNQLWRPNGQNYCAYGRWVILPNSSLRSDIPANPGKRKLVLA